MKSLIAIALALPLAATGCAAAPAALMATGGGTLLGSLLGGLLTQPVSTTAGSPAITYSAAIIQEAMAIHQLQMALDAIPYMPVMAMMPEPVMMSPTAGGTPPIVITPPVTTQPPVIVTPLPAPTTGSPIVTPNARHRRQAERRRREQIAFAGVW